MKIKSQFYVIESLINVFNFRMGNKKTPHPLSEALYIVKLKTISFFFFQALF
jgi:hypothetical protein